ncbi:DNA polymerase III subunit alpha [Candidatus Peregrinibacteria bacterium]|nr:MAG: DNA polymerase III subunit alpha [Candidatus Peregrinibacteria bacterium]
MSNSPSFVHLHAHSHYSLLSALGTPDETAETVAKHGQMAVAITDSGNMHGAAEFSIACKNSGIKPIFGYEAYCAPRSRLDKEPVDARWSQLVLLAKNKEGYHNILRIATEAALSGMFHVPRIDWELLEKYGDGIILLTGGVRGELVQYLSGGGKEEKAKEILHRYQKRFGEDCYIELQRHPTQRQWAEVEPILRKLSQELNIPLVATNDAYYTKVEDAAAHDILLCIKNNTQKNDPSRPTMLGDNFALRSSEEMRELFVDLPEACDNTITIAEKCDVAIDFGGSLLPSFPVPEGETLESYLHRECFNGIEKRYHFLPSAPETEEQKAIIERLEFELSVINSMGFPAYFLIVGDFVQWAKARDILVGPGRGSAAGSLVSYALTITNIDPIRYDLLFERFLNPERVSMPDIDIDFPDERRDEVLEYVRKKYGEDRVAQICTFGTLAARASIKDVGRVMGLNFADMNGFAKLIPERPGITMDEAHETAPDLRKALEDNPRFAEIWGIAKRLEGGVRHVSVHACAVVISPDELTHHTALQCAPKDDRTVITQFSAKPIEKLGLLKMDFLGLKNLTILVRTLEVIEKYHGTKIDLDTIPLDDKKAFTLLSRGQTTGVFQLESSGMKRYLKQLKPTNLEDIIAMVSLYRPGPMEWIPDYISGKHKEKKVKYAHESLKGVLEKTFGIAIYQEQILQIAQVFAGFSLGQADILRRAIGKKIASELAAQREKFIEGAKEKGHSEKLAVKIFDEVIEPFAGYGFNKSHAAGYAMIAYQTAYLKANYPTEFMAALLASDRDNTDRVIIDIEECRELDIEVLPPSVNESGTNFTVVEDRKIRFGLGAIKGIGDSVVESIVEHRGEEPFETFPDFLVRCPARILNKKSLEALAKSGALSAFSEPNEILENIKLITDFAKAAEKSAADENQHSLFDEGGHAGYELVLPETKPASEVERLSWEREILGLFVSDHPLRRAKSVFRKRGVLIAEVPQKSGKYGKKGKSITVGGLLMGLRKIVTKTGKQMAILQIEDPSGKMEAVVFPKNYEELSAKLIEQNDVVFWITGKAEDRDGQWQMIVDKIEHQPLLEIEALAKKYAAEKGEHSSSGSEEYTSDTPPCELDFVNQEETETSRDSSDEKPHLWKLRLKNSLLKSDLFRLRDILRQHSGGTPVEIHAFGQVFYLETGVQMSNALSQSIQEFVTMD